MLAVAKGVYSSFKNSHFFNFFIASIVLVAGGLINLQTVSAASPAPPPLAFSYYMSTVNSTTLYNLGLSFGEKVATGVYPQTSLVVLDWGEPYCTTSTSCGTYPWGGIGYQSTAVERAASEQFAEGFYVGTGTDVSAQTFIAMATSNYGSFISNPTNAFNDGVAWANMVTIGNSWLQSNGIASQTALRAAIDGELDWNGPTSTLQWANGYDSVGTTYYWDIGDAAGCPPFGSCDNGWTQTQVGDFAWGFQWAEPLPEIYNNSLAQEWGQIAQLSSAIFLGPVSQYQACADQGSSCVGTDNTPNQAWDDLYNAINCSSCVPQTPPHLADIRWKLIN